MPSGKLAKGGKISKSSGRLTKRKRISMIRAAHKRLLEKKEDEKRLRLLKNLLGPAEKLLAARRKPIEQRKVFSPEEKKTLIVLLQRMEKSDEAREEFSEIAAKHGMTAGQLEIACFEGDFYRSREPKLGPKPKPK